MLTRRSLFGLLAGAVAALAGWKAKPQWRHLKSFSGEMPPMDTCRLFLERDNGYWLNEAEARADAQRLVNQYNSNRMDQVSFAASPPKVRRGLG